MRTLTDELVLLVLNFVPPTEVLQQVVYVSKHYASLINSETFWRCHALKPTMSFFSSDDKQNNNDGCCDSRLSLVLNKHQLQRYCMYVAWYRLERSKEQQKQPEKQEYQERRTTTSTSSPPAFLRFGSLLVGLSDADRILQTSRRRVCAASSTDHVGERLENVLCSDDRDPESHRRRRVAAFLGGFGVHDGRQRWWSSKPSKTQDSNELLLFCTRYHPLSVISEITLKPLRDPFGHGIVYLWKKTVIRAYQLPSSDLQSTNSLSTRFSSFAMTVSSNSSRRSDQENNNNDDDQFGNPAASDKESMDALLHGKEPVYESPEFFMGAAGINNNPITFHLPHGGILANVFTIELIGKHNEQLQGHGYYACVERVECRGIPMFCDKKDYIDDNLEEQHQQREALRLAPTSRGGVSNGSGLVVQLE